MPRLKHLVPHLTALLKTLGPNGATFEACRQRYALVARDLAAQGVGRITVSRVGDSDAYWAPTQELLEEGMRLGWVKKASTPSGRKYVPQYRDRIYRLTPAGLDAAAKIDDPIGFANLVTDAVLDAHATMRSLLRLLREAPLVVPEVDETLLDEASSQENPTRWLAEQAASRINAGPKGEVTTPERVYAEITHWRTKRFGTGASEPPDRKALVDMLDDALASIALKARGLPIGSIAFGVAAAWGSALRLIDQSRYVPQFDRANVIWLACNLIEVEKDDGLGTSSPRKGLLRVARRGMETYGKLTARQLIEAYRRQAGSSTMATPYLPLHVVRAEAAFSAGVTRVLADMAIEALAGQRWAEFGVEVFLHTGAGVVPVSEPVYKRTGRRTALSIAPVSSTNSDAAPGGS